MASTYYLRWNHGTVTETRWRVIAARENVRVADVLAVYMVVVEHASAQDLRGSTGGVDYEEVAVTLGIDPDAVERILVGMEGKAISGGAVIDFDQRHGRSESTSAERMRRKREREQATRSDGDVAVGDVTPAASDGDVAVGDVTPAASDGDVAVGDVTLCQSRVEKSRVEKSRED